MLLQDIRGPGSFLLLFYQSSNHVDILASMEEEKEEGILLPFKDTSEVHDLGFSLNLGLWP